MKKILFVCLGNICRSPMAEFVMKEKIQQAHLDEEIWVESRATSSWEHGNPVHPGTKRQLQMQNISTQGKTSLQITKKDFEDFDYIIGMDQANVRDLQKMSGEKFHDKIHLFLEIVPEYATQGVPDPYYSGDFDETYRLVDIGSEAWLAKLT